MLGHNLNHSDPRPPGGQFGEVGDSITLTVISHFRFNGFVSCGMRPFQGERVNIHGLSQEDWSHYNNNNNEDLTQVLTTLGVKLFRSKKKNEKIQGT